MNRRAESDACNWLLDATTSDRYCVACNHNRTIPDLTAQAAEKSESNSPFPPNSRMEEFFRRFAMPDASRDDWWQRDFPFPQNSDIARFFRRFGMADAGRDTRG